MLKNEIRVTYLFLCLLILSSCGGGKQGQLVFKDTAADKYSAQEALKIEQENAAKKRADFALEKIRVWKEINTNAKKSFGDVREIFTNKCMNCHDSSFKLPLYGKLFKKINPVHKHQAEGLLALDFVDGYPFKVLGNPPQISILKAIKNSVTEKTMPLKSFTSVYPKKKINEEDEKRILAWVDPIIEQFQEYEVKFNTINGNLDAQVKNLFEMKCFRCHANGNARGGFGGMENTEGLLKSKYVSKDNPEQSKIFTTVRDGEMPPNKMDSLSVEEQYVVRDWLEKVSKGSTK